VCGGSADLHRTARGEDDALDHEERDKYPNREHISLEVKNNR